MAGDDIRLTELINRLEPDMTSPAQRRHDEILGRLDALIDAVQSTTARDHLHRLLAEESAAERRGEPMGVTENPCDHPNHGADTHDCAPFVDTAPDVDPDEDELAHALNAEVVRMVRTGHVTIDTGLLGMDFERNLARVAREYIEWESRDA